MVENVDYGLAIPESDQEFMILPDKAKVRFESTGPLVRYLDEEMAAWRNVDYSIFAQYEQIKNALNQIVAHVGDGGLKQGVINQIRSALCDFRTDTFEVRACVSSRSRLGQLLIAYRKEYQDDQVYRNRASAAFCVAMGVGRFGYRVDATWMLAAVDAAVRLRSRDFLSEDIVGYRRELESLAALGVQQRTDYDGRVADFEAKKAAFEADRKKQFEDDNTKFAEHLKAADDSAKQFEQDYQERIKVLENTYTKLLQLKGPAEYWDELAKSYRGRGWWLLGVVGLIGVLVFGSLLALLFDCDKLPLLNHVKFDAVTVRASLIFIVLTSVAGYLLHLFTRLSISSFHLARDYRERFQLTRVYLALIKDGDIQNEESTRQIVLQSIFSRSDTGLLKGDHALTMPVALGEIAKGNG
ncbi:MAG: DUF6161 domain-containing protein [Lentisphaeraceae bacterium]|nr:DUF6161 domain-containing protein [Lentisphaeraceae bacterium]